jgi:hypothetical protein
MLVCGGLLVFLGADALYCLSVGLAHEAGRSLAAAALVFVVLRVLGQMERGAGA